MSAANGLIRDATDLGFLVLDEKSVVELHNLLNNMEDEKANEFCIVLRNMLYIRWRIRYRADEKRFIRSV